jgi:GTP-binding protein EngB required for normal cell division
MENKKDEKEIYQFMLDGKIIFSKPLESNITSSSIRELLINRKELKNISYHFLDNHGNPIDKDEEKYYKLLKNIIIEEENEKIIKLKSEQLEKPENNIKINSITYFNIIHNKEKFNQNKISEINDNKLTKEEILKAKENGFILIGKTGVGKTSLLNLIYGNNIGKVGYSTNSETKISTEYYIKKKIGSEFIYFCLIDTPGLYDTNGEEIDKIQTDKINIFISEKDIKIKGLLFLSNFQNERFDASEQLSLIKYNSIFPLKDFWKHMVIIFTHYYGDPDGDSKEEIKSRSTEVFSKLFRNIMEKTKGVSEPIDFDKITRQYINIYSNPKKENHFKNNEIIRQNLINEIVKLIKYEPMFTKLCILHIYNYEINENDDNIYNCDLYLYYDANDKIINTNFVKLKTMKKYKGYKNDQNIILNAQICEIKKNGNLSLKKNEEEIFSKLLNSKNYRIRRKTNNYWKYIVSSTIAFF